MAVQDARNASAKRLHIVLIPGFAAPEWELAKLWTYPEIMKDALSSAGSDIVYRTCYRVCAGGPFKKPILSGKVSRWLTGAPQHAIEMWDNDGIVNTISMLWPTGENVLVPADHMDIVGHYKALAANPGEGRRYRTYDLLKSRSGFTEHIFKEVGVESSPSA
jgi:hypothetical protein